MRDTKSLRCEPPQEHCDAIWHWLSYRGEPAQIKVFSEDHEWLYSIGATGRGLDPADAYDAGWRYVAPCYRPPEVEGNHPAAL